MGAGLSVQATIVGVAVGCIFFAFVFDLVRRHRLQERYAMLWFGAAVVMVVGIIASDWLLHLLSATTGINDTSIALLAVVILLLIAMMLHQSVVNSSVFLQKTRLMQEVAILRAEVEALRDRVAGAARDDGSTVGTDAANAGDRPDEEENTEGAV